MFHFCVTAHKAPSLWARWAHTHTHSDMATGALIWLTRIDRCDAMRCDATIKIYSIWFLFWICLHWQMFPSPHTRHEQRALIFLRPQVTGIGGSHMRATLCVFSPLQYRCASMSRTEDNKKWKLKRKKQNKNIARATAHQWLRDATNNELVRHGWMHQVHVWASARAYMAHTASY